MNNTIYYQTLHEAEVAARKNLMQSTVRYSIVKNWDGRYFLIPDGRKLND